MSNAVATYQPRALVTQYGMTEAQIDLITRTICKGADEDELALFMSVCNRTGLDPFMRQLHAVFRYDKGAGRKVMTIQVGIDGYRLLADRTGTYAGSDEAIYDEDKAADHPLKATVTVWKLVGGVRCPFTASARWNEYKPDTGPLWGRMPFVMLAKCAEALALRKAFPAELSGLYTREEMDQANDGVVVDGVSGEVLAAAPRPIRRPPLDLQQPDKPIGVMNAAAYPGVVEEPAPKAKRPVNLDAMRARIAELTATALACGLDVPTLRDDADAEYMTKAGKELAAAVALAEEAGLLGLVPALDAAAVRFSTEDRAPHTSGLSYLQAHNELWRKTLEAAGEKPF